MNSMAYGRAAQDMMTRTLSGGYRSMNATIFESEIVEPKAEKSE
jgi:hypothetical protein